MVSVVDDLPPWKFELFDCNNIPVIVITNKTNNVVMMDCYGFFHA